MIPFSNSANIPGDHLNGVHMVTQRSVLVFLLGVVCSAQQASPNSEFEKQFQAAQTAFAAAKYPQAMDDFKKASKLQEGCARCFIGMGYSYLRMGDANGAEKSAEKALSLATSDGDRAIAHDLKGSALFNIGEPEKRSLPKAEAEFREAARLSPAVASFHLNLARSLMKQSKDDQAVQELNQCLALNPSAPMADLVKKYLANPKRGRGELAPDFHLTTLRGDQVASQELAGRTVVLDFWATWCTPCRESVPELKDLTKKYPGRLVLISVSADRDDNSWREFVAKHEMTWHQYRDSDHQILDLFGVHAFPTYLVIDGDGVIQQRIVGMNPLETIVHRLKAYLATVPELASK
jgi:thiol-disulfide isomerase/thioredoxin